MIGLPATERSQHHVRSFMYIQLTLVVCLCPAVGRKALVGLVRPLTQRLKPGQKLSARHLSRLAVEEEVRNVN